MVVPFSQELSKTTIGAGLRKHVEAEGGEDKGSETVVVQAKHERSLNPQPQPEPSPEKQAKAEVETKLRLTLVDYGSGEG